MYPLSNSYSASQDTSQILCLDSLLAFVNQLSLRLESSQPPSFDVPAPVLLARDKAGKRALLEGAARFNEKPKEGLRFLEANGIIYDDPTLPRPQSLALFFKTCPRLDKKLLGDFISRPENIEVLEAFLATFDFRDVRALLDSRPARGSLRHVQKLMSDCLRELLETFRLPGEAQQISRITELFAKVYIDAEPRASHLVADDDAGPR